MKDSKERCKAENAWRSSGFHSIGCSRTATIKGYCKQHYPPNKEARRKKRDEESTRRWKARQATAERTAAANAERDRRAGCFDELVAALEALFNYQAIMGDEVHALRVMKQACAALAKAKGES